MEATHMKLAGVISTAVLSLALGVAAPAFAQEQHDQQDEQKAQPAQEQKNAQQEDKNTQQEKKNSQQQDKNTQQEQKSAQQQDKNTQQEQKSAQQQDKNAQQEQRNAQQQDKNNQQEQKNVQQQQRAGGNGSGRIPDDKFKANFGREHSFRVSQTDYSNRRFQYGGYSFGFVDVWPNNWLYTQDVYVIEINGVYYLCNASFPGVNLALSFTP
jgi:outer membrane biosynthesis protein TonB